MTLDTFATIIFAVLGIAGFIVSLVAPKFERLTYKEQKVGK